MRARNPEVSSRGPRWRGASPQPTGLAPRPRPAYGGTATARPAFPAVASRRAPSPPGPAPSRARPPPAGSPPPPRAAFRGRPRPKICPALGPAFVSRARPPLAGRLRRRRSARIPSWRSGPLAVGSAEAEAGAAAPLTVSATAARFGLHSRGLPSRSAGLAVGRGRRGRDGSSGASQPGRGGQCQGRRRPCGTGRGSVGGGSVPVCLSVCLW